MSYDVPAIARAYRAACRQMTSAPARTAPAFLCASRQAVALAALLAAAHHPTATAALTTTDQRGEPTP